ncbi:MAG: glycosyltransferase [Myxococcota bacterium]|jgi:glycosyltransferase involved in cell wall biosynthesis|nr:glycosyltransferase [Myxococcota bacterium]
MAEALPYAAKIRVGSHHIANLFIKNNHSVFWLSHSRHPIDTLRHSHHCKKNLLRPSLIEDTSFHYHPTTVLPFRNHFLLNTDFVLKNTLKFCIPALKTTFARSCFSSPDLLWLSQSPIANALSILFPETPSVYRISDRVREFDYYPKSYLNAELGLLKKAKTIFLTSREIYKDLPEDLQQKSILLPNGVHVEDFKANKDSIPLPPEFENIPGPKAIYTGTIGKWLDLELIAKLAQEIPNLQIIFIGPIETDIQCLIHLKNVHFLGFKHYRELKQYLVHSTFGIIPFLENRLTSAINPVKLLEYLASGLPVIATKLAALCEINAPILIAENQEDFLQRIKEVLNDTHPSQTAKEKRINFAQNNSWNQRFEIVLHAIKENNLI